MDFSMHLDIEAKLSDVHDAPIRRPRRMCKKRRISTRMIIPIESLKKRRNHNDS